MRRTALRKIMRGTMRKINETLLELWIGSVAAGLMAQVVLFIIHKELLSCTVGLWIGVLGALLGAYDMWHTLDLALDYSEADAQKSVRMRSTLRYVGFVIIILGCGFTGLANPLAAFAGVMTLKAGAFLQPVTHKILQKRRR